MVFWSTLRNKIKNSIQRKEFENLVKKVDTNTASITTNANNIATNTASITTNANNIATNTASITTNANNIAIKANASDVYLKSQTYTRAEVDNKDTLLSNRIDATADSLNAQSARISSNTSNISNINSRLSNNYYTSSQCDNTFLRKSDNYITGTYTASARIESWIEIGRGYWVYFFRGSYREMERVINVSINGINFKPVYISGDSFRVLTSTSWNTGETFNATFTYVRTRTY